MGKPPRQYAQLPPDDSSSIDVVLKNRLAARVWATAERYRSVVAGKDEVVSDLIEGWLSEYEKLVLEPRLKAKTKALKGSPR